LLSRSRSSPPLSSRATIEVKVFDPDGRPPSGASVKLVPSNREVLAGADGVARLENVAAGTYDIGVRMTGFASVRTHVSLCG
jgi:hypothetical protein